MAGDLDWIYADMAEARRENELEDDWGNVYPVVCLKCGGVMEVLKPGTAVCLSCDWVAHGQGGIKEL